MKVVAFVGQGVASGLIPIVRPKGWSLTITETLEEALTAIRATPTVVVILDRDLAGPDWRPSLRRLASEANCPSVILASQVVDDYLLEEVIQHGGYDVIAKPFREQEVTHTVEFAWSATKSRLSSRHIR